MTEASEALAVSLLFCTRNRAKQLKLCLDHIARLEASCPWELVVVDNGSTDGTGKMLAEFKSGVSFPVTILHEVRPGKSLGLNQAIPLLRGDIVALIDDDCYVMPNYIDCVRETFKDPRIGFAGGRVELFDPTDAPVTIRTSMEREWLAPGSFIEPGWILGANMMLRRDVLVAIGAFDSDLGPGRPHWAEDSDVLARSSLAGWWGVYEPAVVVAHHHGRKTCDVGALNRMYSIGIGAYLAKHTLAAGSRAIYGSMWLRRWYWWVCKALRGGNGLMVLGWEAKGAMGYLALRVRRSLSARVPLS